MKTGIEPKLVQVANNSINAQLTKWKGENHTGNIFVKTKLGFLCKEFDEFEHSSKIDEYDEHEWKQCEFD